MWRVEIIVPYVYTVGSVRLGVMQIEEWLLTCCWNAARSGVTHCTCSAVTAPGVCWGKAALAEAVEWRLGRERKCNSPRWNLARMLKLNIWLINKKSYNRTVLPTAMLGHWNPWCCMRTSLAVSLWLRYYGYRDFRTCSAEPWTVAVAFPDASKPNLPLQWTQCLFYSVLPSDQGMSLCFIQYKESRSYVIALLRFLILSFSRRTVFFGRAYLLSPVLLCFPWDV